jgi:acyl dehydratase
MTVSSKMNSYNPPMTADTYFYFEDAKVGQKFTAGPITMTEEEIITYGRKYDPQTFHTDPEAAKESIFGGLIASGWHTASVTMRLLLEATPKIKGGMIGRSVEKMGWPRPVRPGDQLSLVVEVIEIKPSASNPARGWVRTRNTTLNQKGEPVMEGETTIVVPTRGA